MSQRGRWVALACATTALAVAAGCGGGGGSAGGGGVKPISKIGPLEGHLNLIAWQGYTEPNVVKPFEAQTGCQVHVTYGQTSDDMVRLMRTWLGDADVRIVVGAVTVVDEDAAAARACAEEQVALYLDVVGELDPTIDLRPGEAAPLDKFVLAGTPEDVAAQAQALYEAGAARIEFGTPQGITSAAGVELLADRVLPLLRR